jgi:imidazolonepropionase-like amidohydrolase
VLHNPRIRVVAVAALLALTSSARAEEPATLIKVGRLFDGRSRDLQTGVSVLVEGKRIVRVGRSLAAPAGTRVLDLSRLTVMPGLIDAHTHLALHPGDYDTQVLRETPELRTLWASVNARKTLEAGVTTVRDLGNEGAGYADVALRDAIAKGLVPGPRILAAIRPVTATGAYRLVGYSPYNPMPPISSVADGVADVRREVRKLVADGADVIKIYMESYEKKQLSQDRLTGSINYSQEELNALVEEAHRAAVKVAAHTYSDEAATMAVLAGVDSIEHGLYLSEETFRAMSAKGIAYVPTLLVYELWRDARIFGAITPENRLKLTNTVKEHAETFRRALKTPVKIVFGTDTFEHPGTNPAELAVMVREGMRPADALSAATRSASELLGIEATAGTIEAGKAADLIAFEGDPLADVSVVEKVSFVMKEGVVVVGGAR